METKRVRNGPRDCGAVSLTSPTVEAAEQLGPAHEVVGEHGAGQPGAVRREVARGAVLHAGTFFEVPDVELDHGVLAVEGVDLWR